MLNLFDMLFVCTFPGQFHCPVVTFHYEIFNRVAKNIRSFFFIQHKKKGRISEELLVTLRAYWYIWQEQKICHCQRIFYQRVTFFSYHSYFFRKFIHADKILQLFFLFSILLVLKSLQLGCASCFINYTNRTLIFVDQNCFERLAELALVVCAFIEQTG